MGNLELKQGEAKTIRFTVTDGDGAAVNLSATTLKFAVKEEKADAGYKIEKDDGDFDKTQAATGVVSCEVTAVETTPLSGMYYGELKITFTATNIDKSQDIMIEVLEAVITT